jgi:putative hydrolase of the HAD superfamily
MENITNIIFDLGGIFIRLDFSKTDDAFRDLGVPNFAGFFNQHHSSPLFKELETGRIGEEEFYDNFRQAVDLNLSDNQIRDAWNAMLLDFPAERLDWLKEISQRYKVYLFSNTNIIHYNAFQKIFRESTGKQNFDDYFIKAYYSHDMGLRKPDASSFEEILRNEKLEASETLFIDDTPKNIDGAKQVGLQTILLQLPRTVCDLKL